MEKKSWIGIGIGMAAGAALAYFTSRKPAEPCPAPAEDPPLRPLSGLVNRQILCETVSSAAIREWFFSATNQRPAGTLLILSRLEPAALRAAGYQMDEALDTEHYLFGQIVETQSSSAVAATLFHFSQMDPALAQLLERGKGLVKVSGDFQDSPPSDGM